MGESELLREGSRNLRATPPRYRLFPLTVGLPHGRVGRTRRAPIARTAHPSSVGSPAQNDAARDRQIGINVEPPRRGLLQREARLRART